MDTKEKRFSQSLVSLNIRVAQLEGWSAHCSTWNDLNEGVYELEGVVNDIQALSIDSTIYDIDILKYSSLLVDIASRVGRIRGRLMEIKRKLEADPWHRFINLLGEAFSLLGVLLKPLVSKIADSRLLFLLNGGKTDQKKLLPPG
jgi:hypothetical protein